MMSPLQDWEAAWQLEQQQLQKKPSCHIPTHKKETPDGL